MRNQDADYDSDVAPGGPPQTLTTSLLTITKLAVGEMNNNTYLLRSRATGDSLLIDAANEAGRILDICDGQLDKIVTTHCHADHWLALAEVAEQTGATTYAPAPEVAEIHPTTDIALQDGDVIDIGDARLEVRFVTGHRASYLEHVSTSAVLVFHDPDGSTHVFAGDCLFPGGLGNTCEDPVAFDQLFTDVTTKVFASLPDDAQVHPGHGADTTLGAERPAIAEWRTRGW